MNDDLKGAWVSEDVIKSEIRAGEKLVRTMCIRRTLTSRDDMPVAERFAKGNVAYGMTSTFVEVWMDAAALRDVRERLMKSNPDALIALDAGRIFESDLLAAIPDAMEAGAAEPASPALEPLRSPPGPTRRGTRDPQRRRLALQRSPRPSRHR